VATAGRGIKIAANGKVLKATGETPVRSKHINAALRLGFPYCHSSWVCRRSVLDAVGWYRPMSGMADWDLFQRVASSGPQSLLRFFTVRRRFHDAQMAKFVERPDQQRTLRWFLGERNRWGGMGWTDAEIEAVLGTGSTLEKWPLVLSFYEKIAAEPGAHRGTAYAMVKRWYHGWRAGMLPLNALGSALLRPRLAWGVFLLGTVNYPLMLVGNVIVWWRYAR